jgi:hypothetical protein
MRRRQLFGSYPGFTPHLATSDQSVLVEWQADSGPIPIGVAASFITRHDQEARQRAIRVSTRQIVIVHVIDTAQGATTRYELYEYEYNPSPIRYGIPVSIFRGTSSTHTRPATPHRRITAGSPSPSSSPGTPRKLSRRRLTSPSTQCPVPRAHSGNVTTRRTHLVPSPWHVQRVFIAGNGASIPADLDGVLGVAAGAGTSAEDRGR